MTTPEMHYDYKQKLNKIDSEQNTNLVIPEIDWKLNEAQELFIKTIAEPRKHNHLGFEVNQRSIDDIRSLVVEAKELTTIPITGNRFTISLPTDYLFYVSARALAIREGCQSRDIRITIQQHDDKFESDPFMYSDFEWRHINGVFNDTGLMVYSDGTFSIQKIYLTYIRKPKYMHNAQGFGISGYTTLTGQVLTGTQNCELPEHTHREIVDLAVLLTAGDLSMADYQLKQNKVNLSGIF